MLSSTPLDNEEWAAAVAPVPGGHPHPKWFLNCVLPDFLPHLKGQWIQEAQKHSPGHSVEEPKSQDSDLNTPADLVHPCLPEERGTQLWASWEVPHGWPVSPDSVRSSTPQLFRLESAFPQTPRAECSFDCIIWIKTEGKTLGQVKVLAPFVTEARGRPFWWENVTSPLILQELTLQSGATRGVWLCVSLCGYVYLCLYVSVWVCVYMYLCVSVCMYVCMHIHLCLCLYVCVHVYECVSVCVYLIHCTCISVCAHPYAYVFVCVYVYVCIHVGMCIYLCVCICVCVSMCLYVSFCMPVSVYLFVSLSICMSMCVHVCLYIWMSIYGFISMHMCIHE